MSILIKCDKCGKSDEATKFMHIEAYKRIDAINCSSVCKKCIDVCKECYKNMFKQGD